MVKIVDLIFGKYEVYVEKEFLSEITSFLLKNRISATVRQDGTVLLSKGGYDALNKKFADKINLKSSKYGVNQIIVFIKKQALSIFFILFCSLIYFLLSECIWDIRISGNIRLTDNQIEQMLSNGGISIGTKWRNLDLGMVESSLLGQNDDISWININRRGTVAYVEVVERKTIINSAQNVENIGNILADCDAVIEEIIVNKGVANVKVGDIVKKGDVLISGIVETENGTVLCAAEGSIKGKCISKIKGESKRNEESITFSSNSISSINLNFLNFNINIFKKSRNSDSVCDIIVEKCRAVTPFGQKLPFGMTTEYESVRNVVNIVHTDDDMIKLAHKRHLERLNYFTEGVELISISTEANYTDDGYCVLSRVVYCTDIGVFSEITFE